MNKDEALRLALDWFKCYQDKSMSRNNAEELANELIITIKSALEAKDEPDYKALWQQMCERCDDLDKELAATDRQVEILSDSLSQLRKPLTDEQIKEMFAKQRMVYNTDGLLFARAIEAAHGIKGEA